MARHALWLRLRDTFRMDVGWAGEAVLTEDALLTLPFVQMVERMIGLSLVLWNRLAPAEAHAPPQFCRGMQALYNVREADCARATDRWAKLDQVFLLMLVRDEAYALLDVDGYKSVLSHYGGPIRITHSTAWESVYMLSHGDLIPLVPLDSLQLPLSALPVRHRRDLKPIASSLTATWYSFVHTGLPVDEIAAYLAELPARREAQREAGLAIAQSLRTCVSQRF
jgi:hypothetical protein